MPSRSASSKRFRSMQASRPPDPFLVPLLAEAERELAAHVTEALHLEP